MDFKTEFSNVLEATNSIALATAVGDKPNVRIVNFYTDEKHPGVLFFASDRENSKVQEFSENPHIAYTSIPAEGQIAHVRCHSAVVKKSEYSIWDVQDKFIARIPGYDETIQAIGDTLDVFEIHTSQAIVVQSPVNAGMVSF